MYVMQDPNEIILMDEELGFDAYSLGSCMWNSVITDFEGREMGDNNTKW